LKKLQQAHIAKTTVEKIILSLKKKHKINAEPFIDLKRVKNLQDKTLTNLGRANEKTKSKSHVNIVGKLTKLIPLSKIEEQITSAQENATQPIEEALEWMIFTPVVNFVEEVLSKTNILRSVFVAQTAEIKVEKRKCYKKIPVYNFTTESGTYTANGIIVSNCDDLLYIEAFLRGTPKAIPDKTPQLMRAGIMDARKSRMKARYQNTADIGDYGSIGEFTQDEIDSWQGL